ncbi:MAG: BACON domain-containing protein, partial [Porphyromonas sp.]|uniref:BACON domain-containing protein n=1 Tax=Porphyromonas sp. TaxID=1924944 RepID=UPI001CB11A83
MSVFLLSLLCPSCRPQSDVEEATLELSATALTLPREGTAQTLTITTNQSSWSAFSPQEATWITLRQEGNTLYVGAQANASGQERTGAVLVQAGGLQRRVTVHQTAADVLLEAPESVVLQAEGGSSEVSFECNSDALTIELAEGAGWLRVDKRTAKTFTLVAEANADKHNRTAKITLTAGTAVRELEVTQLGLTPYIFPMLTFPSRLYDIVRYEHERGNTLLYSREETKEQYPSFRFLTKSQVVPLIEYQFSATNSPGFSIATLIYTDKDLVKGNKD